MFLDLWRTFLGASKLACFQSHYTVVTIDLEHPLAEKSPFFNFACFISSKRMWYCMKGYAVLR